MITMAGFELPLKAMRQQIASAVDLIVQANRLQGGPRKITHITEVVRHGAGHDRDARHFPVRARKASTRTAGRSATSRPPAFGPPSWTAWKRPACGCRRAPSANESCWRINRADVRRLTTSESSSVEVDAMSRLDHLHRGVSSASPRLVGGRRRCCSRRRPKPASKTAWPCSPARPAASRPKRRCSRAACLRSRSRRSQHLIWATSGQMGNLQLAVRAGRHVAHAAAVLRHLGRHGGRRHVHARRCRHAPEHRAADGPDAGRAAAGLADVAPPHAGCENSPSNCPTRLELIARALRAGHSLASGFSLVAEEMRAADRQGIRPRLRRTKPRHPAGRRRSTT